MVAKDRFASDVVLHVLAKAAAFSAVFSTIFAVSYSASYRAGALARMYTPEPVAVDFSAIHKAPLIQGAKIQRGIDYKVEFAVAAPPAAKREAHHTSKKQFARINRRATENRLARALLTQVEQLSKKDRVFTSQAASIDQNVSIHVSMRAVFAGLRAQQQRVSDSEYDQAKLEARMGLEKYLENTVVQRHHEYKPVAQRGVQETREVATAKKQIEKQPVKHVVPVAKPEQTDVVVVSWAKAVAPVTVQNAQRAQAPMVAAAVPSEYSNQGAKKETTQTAAVGLLNAVQKPVKPNIYAATPEMSAAEWIENADIQEVSKVTANLDEKNAWVRASAEGYLDSLQLVNTQEQARINLFSLENIRGISKSKQSEYSGVILGRMLQGTRIECSGRTDEIKYLDKGYKPTSADQATYFLFTNTAPGARVVYISTSAGVAVSAVPVLVEQKTVTVLDLTAARTVAVTGRVIQAESAEEKPASVVEVRVIGQAQATAITDQDGRFMLPPVTLIGNHPLVLEVRSSDNYPQRYVLNYSPSGMPTLYHFSKNKIESLLGQLEGGIHGQSGLVIGALPGWVEKQGAQGAYVNVESITSDELEPETYPLSARGELLVGVPLVAGASRFAAFQVPEGVSRAILEDHLHHQVGSELFFTSAGVVNIVGPY